MKKFLVFPLCLFLCSVKLNALDNYNLEAHSLSRQMYEDRRRQMVEQGNYKDHLVKLVLTSFTYVVSLMGSILSDSNSSIPREAFQLANVISAIGVAYSIYSCAVAKTEAEGKCDRYADNLGRYIPSKDEMDSGLYRESYENNGDFNGYKYNIPDEICILK